MKYWEGEHMEDKLIEILETFGYPVMRQGAMLDDEEYPDDFFTFWNNDTYNLNHYDNKEKATAYDFDVNFYSCSPSRTYEKITDAINLLKSNGFIINGRGHDVASDEASHTGRGISVIGIMEV